MLFLLAAVSVGLGVAYFDLLDFVGRHFQVQRTSSCILQTHCTGRMADPIHTETRKDCKSPWTDTEALLCWWSGFERERWRKLFLGNFYWCSCAIAFVFWKCWGWARASCRLGGHSYTDSTFSFCLSIRWREVWEAVIIKLADTFLPRLKRANRASSDSISLLCLP